MDKISVYWLMLFLGISLFAAGGFGNLFFDWQEDESFPVFIAGVLLIALSMIPAKLEERCIAE